MIIVRFFFVIDFIKVFFFKGTEKLILKGLIVTGVSKKLNKLRLFFKDCLRDLFVNLN